MVNKFWCQEVARKWFHKEDEPPHSRFLTEPKCQRHVTTWYLLYRWMIFLAWSCIIICSIFEFGSYEPNVAAMYNKWPIYLTNWDLMLGLGQALLGGYLVSRRWRQQRISDSDDPSKLGFIDRVYWFLYVVTTNTALVVTITYWSSIYDPTIHYLDPLNVMLHICNTILMLLDYCVTSIPFRLRYFWWSLTIVFVYTVFSIIYYLAGGLDKNGYHYIYKILDWKKPVPTSFVCIGQAVFITIVHSLMCFLENVKNKLYLKVDRKFGNSYAETEACSAKKRANIV